MSSSHRFSGSQRLTAIEELHAERARLNRRSFLGRTSFGLGALAYAQLGAATDALGVPRPGLLAERSAGRAGLGGVSAVDLSALRSVAEGGTDGAAHRAVGRLPARIKRVVFLCMAGGPSQLETFDYKPELERLDGKPFPESFTKGQPIAQLQGQKLRALRPLTRFGRYGESGQEISDFLPYTQRIADRIAIVRSVTTTQINHDPAHTVMNTGTQISGRPSMGSWVLYGLGSETRDLPGFVVLTSVRGRNPQPIAARQWHSGFLPSQHQGVEFQAAGDPVHYLSNPPGVTRAQQRDIVDAVAELDALRNATQRDPEVEARLRQYELAFEMQRSVRELGDFSDEPEHIRRLYGTEGGDGSFASNCLLARRLLERGVRFVQLYHRGWDHHGDIPKWMPICCGATDRATAALVLDLERRGLLEDTLVIWGGEFGRTPMFQGKGRQPGRDHHIAGFSMWLAGGGIKGGVTYGATDELGYRAVEDPVSVGDLHATVLHLFGIDANNFTVPFQGLDWRLTGVEGGKVVRGILA